MARDTVFFLAPDDETAAGTRVWGPGRDVESVACHDVEPDSAIAEWDMYFAAPSAEPPSLDELFGWSWPDWVTPPLDDGVEVFALPQRLVRALATAEAEDLEVLAERWQARLTSPDGEDLTDDDLLAVLQGVARLARSAVGTAGGVYSWSA